LELTAELLELTVELLELTAELLELTAELSNNFMCNLKISQFTS
jgi:hypothetical protein